MTRFAPLALFVTFAALAEAPAPTAADKKFAEILGGFETFLAKSDGYEVTSRTAWTYADGDDKRKGENAATLWRAGPKLRLDVPGKSSQLVCVGDGKKTIRRYTLRKLDFHTIDDEGPDDLLDDRLTSMSVRGSGLDLIAREKFPDAVKKAVSAVTYHGVVDLLGSKAHRFTMKWHEDETAELHFAAERDPVLLRVKRSQKVPLRDKDVAVMTFTAVLTWKIGPIAAKRFDAAVPKTSREVEDLLARLRDGGVGEMVGKPVPPLKVGSLGRRVVRLDGEKDKRPMLLFFWNTRAAPSSEAMPAVEEFVKKYAAKGLVIHAVAVGEDADVVRDFVQVKKKLTVSVLNDESREAADALGVTSLPTAVFVGKDGVIKSAHVGFDRTTRDAIVAEAEALTGGK